MPWSCISWPIPSGARGQPRNGRTVGSRILLACVNDVEYFDGGRGSAIDHDVVRMAHKLMGARHTPTSTLSWKYRQIVSVFDELRGEPSCRIGIGFGNEFDNGSKVGYRGVKPDDGQHLWFVPL